MSPTAQRPEQLRNRFFHANVVLKLGLLTKKRLRSNAWRRLFRGIYADSSIPDTHRLRCSAAAAHVLPPHGVLAGRSAATILGAGLAEAGDPVEVVVPAGIALSPMRGLIVHRSSLAADETRRVGRMVVTTPVRTCWDLAQWLDVAEAVVLVDRVLGAGLVSVRELEGYAARRAGQRGWRRFIKVVELADARAGSPQESRLRVGLVVAGLPAPEVQFSVFDERGFVARVDLAWPELKIAVEYDGLWHVGSGQQMHRDRRRLNRLVADGWIVLHITSARQRDDFAGFVAELRAVIRTRRASFGKGAL